MKADAMPLTSKQKDEIETEALKALGGAGGRVQSDLAHGFRVNASRGQVAAIYWSDNKPSNEIEIAVCDSRLSDKYSMITVSRWIEAQRAHASGVCNAHKHGSDWPIIGFSYKEAIAFLARCRSLRMGSLPASLLEALSAPISPEENAAAVLASLRPTQRNAVIDLVHQAGINVAPWFIKQDNLPAASPRSNPTYCYNWAFGGQNDSLLACIWHGSLTISDGEIAFKGNIRALAERLEAVSSDTSRTSAERQRARQQTPRARSLDALFAVAYRGSMSVRVILNEGVIGSEERLGTDSSVVRVRRLDLASWIVRSYSDVTGAVDLVREARNGAQREAETIGEERIVDWVDQYSAEALRSKERVVLSGEAYFRDRLKRDKALQRAGGRCEFCNAIGFMTGSGKLCLETHHVIPLGEGGSDDLCNLAALCANDHREAHYGERASAIRAELLALRCVS